MLTEGATLAMPPTPTWYRGRGAVATGLRTGPLDGARRWRLAATSANGQLAATAHLWDDATGRFRLHHTAVLTLRGALIDAIDAFHDPAAPGQPAA
jgi:RNA polymerase sigma-70 factor (ECF subfamily)